MNKLILVVALGFSFITTDFTEQKTAPLLDNRLFKPAKVVESQKLQPLALSIYKKKEINLPYKGKCLLDSKNPKKIKLLKNIFWKRGLSEKEIGRPLSRFEKNDMHNLFLFLDKNNQSSSGKDECAEFRGSLNYSVPVDFKGDFARACFYMSVQYRIPLSDDWEDVMRMWHVTDPPNLSEMNRNSYIEDVQKNRNPFIDYPELVERIVNF